MCLYVILAGNKGCGRGDADGPSLSRGASQSAGASSSVRLPGAAGAAAWAVYLSAPARAAVCMSQNACVKSMALGVCCVEAKPGVLQQHVQGRAAAWDRTVEQHGSPSQAGQAAAGSWVWASTGGGLPRSFATKCDCSTACLLPARAGVLRPWHVQVLRIEIVGRMYLLQCCEKHGCSCIRRVVAAACSRYQARNQ